MICYRDRCFCSAPADVCRCDPSRRFTDHDAMMARAWWGGDDYPVAWADLCKDLRGDEA